MITRQEWREARDWAWSLVKTTGVIVREAEIDQIEVADLGLGELPVTGLQILTLVSTDWVGAKLLILRPNQFFPQHQHPPSPAENYPGKEEIFRGQWGEAYLYVPGEPTSNPRGNPPPHRRAYCTVWHEVVLRPGDQYHCPPGTWHWFQAGPNGAVLWSFSSKVTDAEDVFLDPQVTRQTIVCN
ncbi:MAG: D-lyxose/D-mannose family sugar isomerase [Anaerolineae bacterium]